METVQLTQIQKKKKVLVVDDDLDFATLMKLYLEQENSGVECEIVNNPYEAVISLADHSYDLIYMDEQMPGINGSRVLKEADRFISYDPSLSRSKSLKRKVPIIMMSGKKLDSSNVEYNFFEVKDKLHKRMLM